MYICSFKKSINIKKKLKEKVSRNSLKKKLKEKAENKGEKHLTTAGYASIISRSVKADKWKPKPRQPFSIDNDSHLRWNRGL